MTPESQTNPNIDREWKAPATAETPILPVGGDLGTEKKISRTLELHKALAWKKEATSLSDQEISRLRKMIRDSGSKENYMASVSKERSLTQEERAVIRNLDQPMFEPESFITAGERSFKVVDPTPDRNGTVEVEELSMAGNSMQWTKKRVHETELAAKPTQPN